MNVGGPVREGMDPLLLPRIAIAGAPPDAALAERVLAPIPLGSSRPWVLALALLPVAGALPWLSRALGRQVLPDIEGLDQDFVVSCDDVLSGNVELSGKVVVIVPVDNQPRPAAQGDHSTHGTTTP